MGQEGLGSFRPRGAHTWPLLAALLAAALGGCAHSDSPFRTVEQDDLQSREQDPDLLQSAPPDLLQGAAPDFSAATDLGPAAADLSAAPDLAAVVNCQVLPQSGCPMGQRCNSKDGMTTLCQPVGTVPRGQRCNLQSDDCEAGKTCADEGGGIGQCRPFCNGDADCGPLSYCDDSLPGGKYKLCTTPCTATYPGTKDCLAGLGCFVYKEEHTDCLKPGTRDVNQSCTKHTDCKSGMLCLASACHRTCRRGDRTVCLTGEKCWDVVSGAYNWTFYGVCCDSFFGC